jgi:hypothetical protein
MEPLNKLLMEKAKVQAQLHYADLPEKDAGMQTARVSFDGVWWEVRWEC